MEIATATKDDTNERKIVVAAYKEPDYGSDGAKQKGCLCVPQ